VTILGLYVNSIHRKFLLGKFITVGFLKMSCSKPLNLTLDAVRLDQMHPHCRGVLPNVGIATNPTSCFVGTPVEIIMTPHTAS
jgi:hypothetical protein